MRLTSKIHACRRGRGTCRNLACAPRRVQAQDSEPVHIALAGPARGPRPCSFWSAWRAPASRASSTRLTFFNGEELAIQAILAGQADVGLGSPYSVISARTSVRLFYQVSRIIFFPVVNAEIRRTGRTWTASR